MLQNKVFVITGAYGQLGRSVSLAIAKQGGTGVLLSRTPKSCAAIYDEITRAGYTEPALFPIDFTTTDESKWDELALSIGQQFGRCDGLIHCAGVIEKLCPIVHFPPALWHKTLAVELTAPFLLTQRLLPLMQQTGDAHILYVLHPIAQAPKAYWAAMAAAKAGLESFAQVLADELSTQGKVSVNCIVPPHFQSRSHVKLYPGITQETLPTADQVAIALISQLISAEKAVNGETIQLPLSEINNIMDLKNKRIPLATVTKSTVL